jgi:predicted HicB family RNase H-like nuclease
MKSKPKTAKKELKTVNINFAIEPTFNERLVAQANKEGRSLSNFIRYALDDYLQRVQEEEERRTKRR